MTNVTDIDVVVGRTETGLGSICTDENSEDRQCEDQEAHGLSFPDLSLSMILL